MISDGSHSTARSYWVAVFGTLNILASASGGPKFGPRATRMASGEIDTDAKKNKLIEAYIDEMLRKYLAWEDFRFLLVAGA